MNEKERQKMREVERLCHAINHFIKSYDAVPHFPENEQTLWRYRKGYEDNLEDLKELLNEQ